MIIIYVPFILKIIIIIIFSLDKKQIWGRPVVEASYYKDHSLLFMQTAVDYTFEPVLPGMPGLKTGTAPVIRFSYFFHMFYILFKYIFIILFAISFIII
jgi:hypothetical protein